MSLCRFGMLLILKWFTWYYFAYETYYSQLLIQSPVKPVFDPAKCDVIEWHVMPTCCELRICESVAHCQPDVIIKALGYLSNGGINEVNLALDLKDLKGSSLCCVIVRMALHFVFVVSDSPCLILKAPDLSSPLISHQGIAASKHILFRWQIIL